MTTRSFTNQWCLIGLGHAPGNSATADTSQVGPLLAEGELARHVRLSGYGVSPWRFTLFVILEAGIALLMVVRLRAASSEHDATRRELGERRTLASLSAAGVVVSLLVAAPLWHGRQASVARWPQGEW
jgi:hypothetical protein